MNSGLPASETEVATRLRAQLERLKAADPFRVLDLPVEAAAEEVRRAFITLTKQYHPNRFARHGQDVRTLANEVFLLIRRAYDNLSDEEKRKRWRERVAPQATPSRFPSATNAPGPAAQPGATGPATSTPPAGVPRAPTVPAGAQPTPPADSPVRPPSRPPAGPPPAAVKPQTNPTSPPAQGSSGGRAPTVPAGRAPSTVPPRSAGTSGALGQDVQAMLEQARTRHQRYEDALTLLRKGRYKEAREMLYAICAEDPHSKRYRSHLHLAWGLEHMAENRGDDAKRELERARDMDPESEEIRAALAKAEEQFKKKGILGKLFGK